MLVLGLLKLLIYLIQFSGHFFSFSIFTDDEHNVVATVVKNPNIFFQKNLTARMHLWWMLLLLVVA